MNLQRKVGYSVRRKLNSIFTNETLWGTPFTVLNRADWGPLFSQARPFIFIVAEGIASDFRMIHAPIVIIETARDVMSIGLGGERASVIQVSLHLFARSTPERNDIQDAIVDNFLVTVGSRSVPGLELYDVDGEGEEEKFADVPLILTEGLYWTESSILISPFAPYDKSGSPERFQGCILSTAILTPTY